MLEMKKCCKVPYPEKLFEEYEVKENTIYANVNASKVLEMMKRFIDMHDEPLFFILEIPCKYEDGITESKKLVNLSENNDVYFIDGMNADGAKHILDSIGVILVDDGMNLFGIGCHEAQDEILFGKYNVMTVYTAETEKYNAFFDAFGIKKVDSLVTAWDTFDKEHSGECTLYVSKENGKTVYDIPEDFKEYGMYFYKQRIEDEEEYNKEVTFDDLPGKVLLVGITYYTHENKLIEQKQFYGTVTEANEKIVRMILKDGSEFTLPPDLRSTKRARPGEYTLRSTGEVVVNPDFLATWNLTKAKEE